MSEMVKTLRRIAHECNQPYSAAAADEIERKDKDAAIAELLDRARAIIYRWESPLWKDLPHTGEYIARLRASCDKFELTTTKEAK